MGTNTKKGAWSAWNFTVPEEIQFLFERAFEGFSVEYRPLAWSFRPTSEYNYAFICKGMGLGAPETVKKLALVQITAAAGENGISRIELIPPLPGEKPDEFSDWHFPISEVSEYVFKDAKQEGLLRPEMIYSPLCNTEKVSKGMDFTYLCKGTSLNVNGEVLPYHTAVLVSVYARDAQPDDAEEEEENEEGPRLTLNGVRYIHPNDVYGPVDSKD